MQVRFGAGIARLAGRPRLGLELAHGATVRDLLAHVGEREPDLGDALNGALSMVRGRQALPGDVLHDGDEVSLLMPAAGGAPIAAPPRRFSIRRFQGAQP